MSEPPSIRPPTAVDPYPPDRPDPEAPGEAPDRRVSGRVWVVLGLGIAVAATLVAVSVSMPGSSGGDAPAG